MKAEVRIYISTKGRRDNIFLVRFYPLEPSSKISRVKQLLSDYLKIPAVVFQIISSNYRKVLTDESELWQHATQEDVWRPPLCGKGKVKVTQYTADYFIFLACHSVQNISNDFDIPTLVEPFDLSSWNFTVPVQLHPTKKNQTNDQDLIKLDNEFITVKLSSSYDIPFAFPNSGSFRRGSTAYDIKKYITQFTRIDTHFIDLGRKGMSKSLEDDEKFNSPIDLVVMRKFDVQLDYRVDNTKKVLQYTLREGNTTIAEFLEDMKTSNDLVEEMSLSIPDTEVKWSSTDLLNSINGQKLVLSVNDFMIITLSSLYDLPFVLPESGRFPRGSTADDIKKYIAECSNIDARFIDLGRKGMSESLKDDKEFNSTIDLEVMRKFDVLLDRVSNTKLLQYTLRDGSTTIAQFLEEIETSNQLARGMLVLLSIPGTEEQWSSADLLNSFTEPTLVLSINDTALSWCSII